MSTALYGEALRESATILLRREHGPAAPLPSARWCGPLDEVDERVINRLDGPTIDIGCGPGRFVAGVGARGLPALGIDISTVAIELTQQRGALALQRDVFGALPGNGRWRWALLMDGNIGIGGEPVRLLTRVARLLAPAGRLMVEVEPPGGARGSGRVRLEGSDRHGAWFPWAWVPTESLGEVAAASGLRVRDTWSHQGRFFGELRR